MEITRRQTNKEEKSDVVWIKTNSKDEEGKYVKEFGLYYDYFDTGGWILGHVIVENSDNWQYTPIRGVTESRIQETLERITVQIEEDYITITPDVIETITIKNQKTDLDELKDVVVATVVANGQVQEIKGDILLTYEYDIGWMLVDYEVEDFTSQYRQDMDLSITKEYLTSQLDGISFYAGGEQTINKGEISDLSIEEIEEEFNGTRKIVDVSFQVQKPLGTIGAEGNITFEHDEIDGWKLNYSSFTTKAISLDTKGKWEGEISTLFGGESKLILDLSEMTDEGDITAVYNFSALPSNPGYESGSYTMSGNIDLETFEVNLEGEEWIHRPNDYDFLGVNGYLDIEQGMITREKPSYGGTSLSIKKQ